MHTDRACDDVSIACYFNCHLRAVIEDIWSWAKLSSNEEFEG